MNEQKATIESLGDKLDAKSGWMFNQERFLFCLKRWRRRWFVLDRDCTLRYFERPETTVANGAVVFRKPFTLFDSSQLGEVDPPQGCSRACLLKIETADGRLTLCSEDPVETRAWLNLFESIRGYCTTPLPVVHEIVTPVLIIHTTTTTPTMIQSTDATKGTPVVICQATPSHVGYQQITAAAVGPAAIAPLAVRPV